MAAHWYIVHDYSNFENKVAQSIKDQAAQRGLSDKFEEILVPMEKVVEVRRGKKVDAERKFFPGYVLVKCDLTDEVFHLIKNVPKVTGFLGADKQPSTLANLERTLARLRAFAPAAGYTAQAIQSGWLESSAMTSGMFRKPQHTAPARS